MRLLIPPMLLVFAALAAAQVPQPSAPALASSESDDLEYGWEDAELWGAHAVEVIPADARLLIDYEMSAGTIRQRLRIYAEGYVRAEWDEGESRTDRLLMLPEEGAEQWRSIVSSFSMSPSSYRPSSQLSNDQNHGSITILREGVSEVHAFSTAAALPAALGTLRSLLDALADAIVRDRQVSNPLSIYVPAVGDVLVDPEGHEYRVSRVIEQSRMVELRRKDLPSTTWVRQRDLYTMFVSVLRGGASSR